MASTDGFGLSAQTIHSDSPQAPAGYEDLLRQAVAPELYQVRHTMAQQVATHNELVVDTSGRVSQGISDQQLMFNQLRNLIENDFTSRALLLQHMTDPRRDYYADCGWPKEPVDPQVYWDLYEREPVANRVASVFPNESWQIQPSVYEEEDGEVQTDFEFYFDKLGGDLLGEDNWFKDTEGSPLWDVLRRADVLSGVGRYAVLFLGIDDNKPFDQPAAKRITPSVNKAKDKPKDDKPYGLPQAQQPPGQPNKAASNPFKPQSPSASPFKSKKPNPFDQPSANALLMQNAHLRGAFDDEGRYAGSLFSDREFKHEDFYDNRQPPEDTPEYDEQTEAEHEDEYPEEPERPEMPTKLKYIRIYPESMARIAQYEEDVNSPRYGQPVMYEITMYDPAWGQNLATMPMVSKLVHWTRTVHIAVEVEGSEVFARPRMQSVLNPLLDIQKTRGASAEMFWRGGLPGWSFETHPQLGGQVNINLETIRSQMQQWADGLQRFIAMRGISAKSLAPQVSDPTAHITIQIESICIQLTIPIRVFKGSERGELASSQDDAAWNDRLRLRQNMKITPRIIIPLINRLIWLGVLPEPKQYHVWWPDLESQTDEQKSNVALKYTQALVAYISGQGESAIIPLDFFTYFLGFSDKEAQAIIDNASMLAEERQAEELLQAEQDMEMQRQMIDEGLAPDPTDPDVIKAKASSNPFAQGLPPKGASKNGKGSPLDNLQDPFKEKKKGKVPPQLASFK